jgi:hypothetical protein
MSTGCWIKVHICYNETLEVANWDVACDEHYVEWTDTFAKLRSLVLSGALTQKFGTQIQRRISAELSKGVKHYPMYLLPPVAPGKPSRQPELFEVRDEDATVR